MQGTLLINNHVHLKFGLHRHSSLLLTGSLGGVVHKKKDGKKEENEGAWKCDVTTDDTAQSSALTRCLNHLESCVTFILQTD